MASAGPEGLTAVPEVVSEMVDRGMDLTGHRSTASYPGLLASSDLIICFEAHHAAAAIVQAGARRERTFLMRELLDELPRRLRPDAPASHEEARQQLSRIAATRSGDFFDARYQYFDPMEGPAKAYRRSIVEIIDMSDRVASRLFGLTESPEIAPDSAERRFRFLRRHRRNLDATVDPRSRR
jgi:protein-tyrosine-phosphatase